MLYGTSPAPQALSGQSGPPGVTSIVNWPAGAAPGVAAAGFGVAAADAALRTLLPARGDLLLLLGERPFGLASLTALLPGAGLLVSFAAAAASASAGRVPACKMSKTRMQDKSTLMSSAKQRIVVLLAVGRALRLNRHKRQMMCMHTHVLYTARVPGACQLETT
jgi:hypothetical protein